MKIPFNKPFLTGNETKYIEEAVRSMKISGDGIFTKKCHAFFEEKYGFKKCLLTTSCTDALEMAAILINIEPGDEVIIPSYTFVSTANAFVLRGAKIIFADSLPDHPNIDVSKIESLITSRTKAIVPVHYGGVACDMDEIMALAKKYNLYVIEDAAQAIDSYYKGKPLGSFGHLAAFSFHETKNIISGEGGALLVNNPKFIKRAEIIWQKGTDRNRFMRGEIDKYTWRDIGSSFLPGELTAALLWAQLQKAEKITKKRLSIWNYYHKALKKLEEKKKLRRPVVPKYCRHNAHMYYLLTKSENIRNKFIQDLKRKNILSVFHYVPLHNSPKGRIYRLKSNKLLVSNNHASRIARLPLYVDLKDKSISIILRAINQFFKT